MFRKLFSSDKSKDAAKQPAAPENPARDPAADPFAGMPPIPPPTADPFSPPPPPASTFLTRSTQPATVIFRAEPATYIAGTFPKQAANRFDAKTRLIRPRSSLEDATVFVDQQPANDAIPPLPDGSILNNEFRVLKPLGRGGMGFVYLCEHTKNGQLAAVKEACATGSSRSGLNVINGNPTYQFAARAALLQEVSALARISISSFPAFESVFEENNTIYFAMSYVEGEPLSSLLERRGLLSASMFETLASTLTDALDALHAADLIHCDLKPANIVARPDKTFAVIDFGASRRISSGGSSDAVVTAGYSPMEKYLTNADLGRWTDVYSAGATLAAAMTGQIPPDAITMSTQPQTRAAYFDQLPRTEPEWARWSNAIEQAMSPDAASRPQDMASFRKLLGIDAPQEERKAEPSSDGQSLFISYSHLDAERVEQHVKSLQMRGVGVWIDRDGGIKPGSPAWAGDITRGMRGASHVLVFSSANSMNSEAVRKEIYLADTLGKQFIVVRLDQTAFHDDVMLFLAASQHIDATQSEPRTVSGNVLSVLNAGGEKA